MDLIKAIPFRRLETVLLYTYMSFRAYRLYFFRRSSPFCNILISTNPNTHLVVMSSTHLHQNPRNRNKNNRQKRQRRTGPTNPKIIIHSPRKQRKPGTKRRPKQVIPGQHRSRIHGIRIGQIIQHGVEEQERADGEEPGAHDGHDPVDTGSSAPAEPEETDGDEAAAYTSGREPILWFDVAVGVESGLEPLVEPVVEGGNHEEGADEDADVGEALLAEVEVVDAHEDDGEGLEPDVEEAVDEGDVHVEEEDHGLEEVESEWSDEDGHCEFSAG